MNIKVLLVLLFFNIFYLFYRFIAKKIYINEISRLKQDLFLKSFKSGIDTSSKDYSISEYKLDIFIKMADTNTMLDFLFFKNFLVSKKSKVIEKEYKKIFNIKSEKMREIDNVYFDKAIMVSKKHLFFGTFTGIIYTAFIVLKLILKTPKNKLKNNNIFDIFKKILNRMNYIFKKEIFLESKIDSLFSSMRA